MEFNKIIIGGGLYGLYSALLCGKNGQTVCLLEYESESFARATYINQAQHICPSIYQVFYPSIKFLTCILFSVCMYHHRQE